MTNFLKTIFSLLILALTTPLFAQQGQLKGTVRDSTGKGIISADVVIGDTHLAASTDANGNYFIENIPAGNYTVTASSVGYRSVTNKVSVGNNETTELSFRLTHKINELKAVTVIGKVSVNGMGHMPEVHDAIIYSGKKTEVLVMDSLDANTAQNNPREVLGRVPGSNYSETEGGGFPSNGVALRGLRPTQSIEIQTRQNGYNIAADLYGYPETYYMPPLEGLQRIEIIRGASSLQFGPQFGGVINFVTKDAPEDKKFEFNTQQTGGSYGFFNSYNSAGGTIGKWDYFSFIQYKATQGYRPNSDVKQVTGFAKLEYKVSNNLKIGLEYSLLRNYIHMAGGLSDSEYAANPESSYRTRNWLESPWNITVLTAEWKATDKTMVTLKSAWNNSARNLVWRNEDGGPETLDTINPLTNQYDPREVEHEGFNSLTTELRTLTYYKIGKFDQSLAVGIRYFQGAMRRQEGGPGSTGSDFDLNLYGGPYANDMNFTTLNLAPFAENTFHLGKAVSITPGFRYEYIRSRAKGYITDDATDVEVNADVLQNWYLPLFGLGMQIKTTPTTNVYGNISQSYEPTNYSNLTPLGVASVIDPNLKDVSGYNADLGWRGNFGDYLNFDVGGFYLEFNDEIGIETLTDYNGNPYTYRTNVGDAVHKGIETYIEFNPFRLWFQNTKFGQISFFNSYSFDKATYVTGPYKGNYEEMAPINIDRIGIIYSYHDIFSTTFLISTQGKAYADANNTVFSSDATVGLIPGYTVVDWSNTIRLRNYNIKLGVSNLLNKNYFSLRTDEYPGPGIIPAQPRSVYVGFGAKF